MADSNIMPRVKGPDDTLGHAVGMALKDSYRITHPSQDALDILSAGLNGYGDFVIVGNGSQVIRIPDEHRVKLAAHLLAPLMDTEPLILKAVAQVQSSRKEREMPDQLRARPVVPKTGGVVAKPW